MIKRIKDSLLTKVFLITSLLLVGMSFLVYGILAWYMPKTYADELNAALDEQAKAFVSELSHVTKEESGSYFDAFLQREAVDRAELFTKDGKRVELPTMQEDGEVTWVLLSETVSEGSLWYGKAQDNAPVISGSYPVSFLGEDADYTLVVYGRAEQIAELRHSFISVFPVIMLAIVMVSMAAAWLFSKLITNPVLRISRIAKEMSELQLDWQPDEKRTDELGTLEKSLNHLSRRLSASLKDLREANEKLELDIAQEKALEQAQMEFFSAVSHELKTPVTIIKGQLEGMLFEVGVYKDHKKYLARALETVNVLESMVQEILIVSRLEHGSTILREEQFDLAELINRYLEETEDLLIRKELQVTADCDKPVMFTGNKQLIQKVFSNLINNAVKYAPDKAMVYIILKESERRIEFSVENTGTHIPDESLPKIFDAFYRIEQSRNRKTGGSGLGLYIVQKILERYGSVCEVCNTETGVKFSFIL